MLDILWLPADNGGCGFYRMIQPSYSLQKFGIANSILALKGNYKELDMFLDACNVFIVQRALWCTSREDYQNSHPKTLTVMDIDDNMEDTSPFSSHYKGHGLKEVIIDDPTGFWTEQAKKRGQLDRILPNGQVYLWKDKEDGLDIKANFERKAQFHEAIKNMDMIMTSTDPLRSHYKGLNHNIHVMPNCVDLEYWQPSDTQTKEVRIGWHGGPSHYEDWVDYLDVVERVTKKYPQVKWVICGELFPILEKIIPPNQIEHHLWVHVMAHPYFQRLLKLDIAFVPLKDSEFNRCKSDIKFVEFSSMGVPCVTSKVTPYRETCGPANLALMGSTPKEVEDQLSRFIESPELRREYGDRARQWVEENRSTKVIAPKYLELFEKQLEKKVNKSCLIV